jgi:c-di-GMP-binding flagellar brake protein YcgR
MWDGFNKRKFPRLNIHCEINILSEEEKAPIRTSTENLGVGGVCVILDKPLERFSKCRVKLDLQHKEFLCDAKVVWIVPTRSEAKSTKRRFDTGLEFVGLEPEQLSAIRGYIEKSVQKSPV